MNKTARIYVAGHTGLVGSALLRCLYAPGYEDITTKTHKELDLTDRVKTEAFFRGKRPEYVFIAAAKVGGIQANSKYPADFIYQNLMIQTNLIDLSYHYGVKKLLFLGSSCTYPKVCPQPIKEEYLLTGSIEPTNEPFGVAKIAGIKMCQAYNKQHGTHFIVTVPANAYGVNDHFDPDRGHVIPSLIRRFHEAKILGLDSVTIWGTGKPRREFLYVDDLAEACIFLMNHYDGNEIINIGTGENISIAALADLIKETVGFTGQINYDESKPDGIPNRLLDVGRITSLGWRPRVRLQEGLRLTYEFFKKSMKDGEAETPKILQH